METKQLSTKKINTQYLVLTALFTALSFAVTMFANIPAAVLGANGNINLGDSVIIIASFILGPVGGAIAGGFGAALADIAGGYLMYSPFTLIIKGAAALISGYLFRIVFHSKKTAVKRTVCILIYSAIIVAGYFLAELILMSIAGGERNTVVFLTALRTIPANLLQVAVSGVIAALVSPKLEIAALKNIQ
jgi:uncharacterized membrane protein